jgi:hypothetical protein
LQSEWQQAQGSGAISLARLLAAFFRAASNRLSLPHLFLLLQTSNVIHNEAGKQGNAIERPKWKRETGDFPGERNELALLPGEKKAGWSLVSHRRGGS